MFLEAAFKSMASELKTISHQKYNLKVSVPTNRVVGFASSFTASYMAIHERRFEVKFSSEMGVFPLGPILQGQSVVTRTTGLQSSTCHLPLEKKEGIAERDGAIHTAARLVRFSLTTTSTLFRINKVNHVPSESRYAVNSVWRSTERTRFSMVGFLTWTFVFNHTRQSWSTCW